MPVSKGQTASHVASVPADTSVDFTYEIGCGFIDAGYNNCDDAGVVPAHTARAFTQSTMTNV